MGEVVSEINRLDAVLSGKRVLVTGHTGFKGSWLSLWLTSLGADVLGYSLEPVGQENLFSLLSLENKLRHVVGDIRDYESLREVFSTFKPEVVFHLAAQALVRESYMDPKTTYDTNVGGAMNVLELVRTSESVRCLVYVTSDKCYENKEWTWGYRENDALGGHDPYSASKAAAEVVFSSYEKSFFSKKNGFSAASVRAGNVIGGGDWSVDRLIPDAVRALRNGVPIGVRNPESTRPWQHVLEPLSGYIHLAERLLTDPDSYSGAWNFGPSADSVQTVGQITKMIVDRWGSGEIAFTGDPTAPHEARLLHLNCDKARLQLDWKPKWDVDTTIDRTVSWYRDLYSGKDPLAITQKQIFEYQEVEND